MTSKNVAIVLVVSAVLLLAGNSQPVTAQTASSPTVEELQKQVQLLLSQMASLQKEIASLKSGVAAPVAPTVTPSPITISAPSSPMVIDESEVGETGTQFIPPPALVRSLSRGSRGEDVRQLQEFLAQAIICMYFIIMGMLFLILLGMLLNLLGMVEVVVGQTIFGLQMIYSLYK